MLYDYPSVPHTRIHGPGGYADPTSYKDWLRDEFKFRCVYCMSREKWSEAGDHIFGVEHILPKSRKEYEHLACVYTNLLYACNRCNSGKGTGILLSPCDEAFGKHMHVEPSGEVKWLTTKGQKIVRKLRLNDAVRTEFRRWLIALHRSSAEKPGGDTASLISQLMGYPSELPDLSRLAPPSNSNPEGIAMSHFERRKRGELRDTY